MTENHTQQADATQPVGSWPSHHRLWIETAAVLWLLLAPELASLIGRMFWGHGYSAAEQMRIKNTKAVVRAAAPLRSMIFASMYLPVVMVLLWKGGDPWSTFGLVRPRWDRDILIGMVMYFAINLSFTAIRPLISPGGTLVHTWADFLPAPTAAPRLILLLASSCVVGFSEELIGRCYLIARFETLLGSSWGSLLLTTGISLLMHLYKGPVGLVHTAISGLIWGGAFCKLRTIWPVAISHALIDFVVGTHLG